MLKEYQQKSKKQRFQSFACFYLVQRGYDYTVNCSHNSTVQFFTFHGFAFICIISLYLHNNSPQGSKQ